MDERLVLMLEALRSSGNAHALVEKFDRFTREVDSTFKSLVGPARRLQAEIFGLRGDVMDSALYANAGPTVAAVNTLRAELYCKDNALFGISIISDSSAAQDLPATVRIFVLYDNNRDSSDVRALSERCQESFDVQFSPLRLRSGPPRLMTDIDDLTTAEVPSEEEVTASYVLAKPENKTLARAVKLAGDVLSNSLESLLSKQDKFDVAASQEELLGAGILQSETVVMCRKTGSLVNRIPDPSVLKSLSELQVRCSCGEPMGDEDIEEAVRVSTLGYRLLEKSQWMNVVLLNELLRLDIPISDIFIEQQFGGDEVDCLAVISGDLVLFELKDGEFNLGHAYSFNAKNGLLNPDVSVVVTTSRVGSDAREHFERTKKALESSRRGRVRMESGAPVFIEGMNSLSVSLETITNRLVARDARRFVQGILDAVAFRAMPVILSMIGVQPTEDD